MRTRALTASVLTSLALCGAAAGTASADSILYLKDGNVWLSTPDGARQFQVTEDGGYSSASQADDGTIAALKGQEIVKLDRFGEKLAQFKTPVSDGDTRSPITSYFEGPFDAEISPDGSKVAYTFYWQYYTFTSTWSGQHYLRQGVGISHSDRMTGWDEPGHGYTTGWLDPSWYDGETLLMGRKAGALSLDLYTDKVGSTPNDGTEWFKDGGAANLREPEATRQKTKLAVVGGDGESLQLRVYRLAGDAPALPEACYGYDKPSGGTFASPTFSPDGGKLAWQEGDGVFVGDSPDLSGGCQRPGDGGALTIPGATKPDWGPADVPTSRPVKPGAAAAEAAAAPATPAVAVKPRTSRRAATTLTQSVRCRRACTVRGELLVKGRRVAAGRGTARKAGTAKVTLAPTAAGRKALASLKGRPATLRLTVREGGRTRRLTKSVTL